MSKIRVRFAPSPTGYLHIGGARTALYNYIFAKAVGGTFILRVEDTDLERSTPEFEKAQLADLKWLGLEYSEGPDVGGDYGPYRQSERMHIYADYAQRLIKEGKAFYDFCSDEELEAMKEANHDEGAMGYTGKWREEKYWPEAHARVAKGEKAPIRFKVLDKAYAFDDKVRGHVAFPAGMVGDFVILRSNGMPTYNFCNVVDDSLQKITHVIRGEDHVNNTVRQLMIYEALGATVPIFAHVSLLIGADRQKLSKRHGATSVNQYREMGILPEALTNYLCLLGWSHPEEKDVFDINDLSKVFNLERFSKSHAIYDTEKLRWINGQHIKHMMIDGFMPTLEKFIVPDHFYFKQSREWKHFAVELFREKIHVLTDFQQGMDDFILNETLTITDELKEILSWPTTRPIAEYLFSVLKSHPNQFVSANEFESYMEHCKVELKIKGKPLFMGMRGVLTGQGHGPDLKILVPLTPVNVLKKRIESILRG